METKGSEEGEFEDLEKLSANFCLPIKEIGTTESFDNAQQKYYLKIFNRYHGESQCGWLAKEAQVKIGYPLTPNNLQKGR